MAERKRRSVRQAIIRKVSVYVEDSSVAFDIDEVEDVVRESMKRARPLGTRTRRGPQRPSDSDDSDASPPASSSVRPRKRTRPTRRVLRSATVGESTVNRVTALVGRRRHRSAKRVSRDGPVSKPKSSKIPSDGITPPWETLPYAILLQIFSYTTDSPTWLLKSARGICRTIAAPALAVFYQNPRLPTASHLQTLYSLVSKPSEVRTINYRAIVKCLDLDIHTFVNRKDENDTFEVAHLVKELPQLDTLLITSVQDKPPYRRHALPRWKYPSSLFEALESTELSLKRWRWNWLFIRHQKTAQSPRLYDYMCKHHQSPSFRTLRHLEISDHPEFVASAEDQAHQAGKIAEAISLLPTLRSLELEPCDIVNARFLERLPKTLTRLRLANCEALDSEAMQVFLSQDGGCQLEELVLDHNVRLDITFLPLLRSSCLRLRVLSMDLHYYSQHHTINDADARYKHLLGPDDIPTWPPTLQTIQLVHLQKWDAAGAQNLFSSLIQSAPELLSLRTLILQAHISISWRDRATFREKWIDKLTRVFLRRAKSPNPDLASLKAFRLSKQREEQRLAVISRMRELEAVAIPHSPNSPHAGSDTSEQDGEAAERMGRRSRRLADNEKEREEKRKALEAAMLANMDMSSSASESETPDEDDDDPPAFVQGLCNVVEVTIDNQRPREEQFNESHFLDSEESGDEDWREGGDVVEEEDGYAW